MSWDTIIADPEFQVLEPDRKQKIANNYFAKNFESDKDFISLPEEKRFKIKSNFESTLNIEKPLPSRGLFMDVATAPVRGLVNAAETYGRAARTIDPEGGRDFVRDIGTKVVGLTEKVREKAPYIFKPSKESEKGIIRKAITEGTESFAHSLATGLPGAIVGAVGGIPGMIAGYAASGGTLFGLAEYDQFLEEASSAINERKDLTPEEKTALIEKAKPFARKSALVEGGFEFASDLAEGLTMKIGKPFTQLAKGSIRGLLTTTPKQVLLNMAKVASIETPTEMTQTYLETGLRQKAGIDTGLTPKQAAAEVIGPTLFSSVLFGALGSRFDYKQKQKIRNALIDPKVDIAEREGAINTVAPILSKINKPFTEAWTLNALNSVAQRKPIDIDIPFEKIERPKATGLKLEQPVKAEVPKFDATPDIKTTGQGLKIEPVIEKPIKKPVVSHEEDIIVKGEKLVTLEKPVSKPITEGLPIEKEIPVTLKPEDKLLPNGQTVGQYLSNMPQDELKIRIDGMVNQRNKIEEDLNKPLSTGRTIKEIEIEEGRPDTLTLMQRELDRQIEFTSKYLKPKEVIASEETKGQEAQRGLPIVPEQGTSPQTKGLPTGEASPVVSKEPWQTSLTKRTLQVDENNVIISPKGDINEQSLRSWLNSGGRDIHPQNAQSFTQGETTTNIRGIQFSDTYGGGREALVKRIEDTLQRGYALPEKEAEGALAELSRISGLSPERYIRSLDTILRRVSGESPLQKGATIQTMERQVLELLQSPDAGRVWQSTQEQASKILKDYPELQAAVPGVQTVSGVTEKASPVTHTMPSGEVMPGAEHKEPLEKEGEQEVKPLSWGKAEPSYMKTISGHTAWGRVLRESKEVAYLEYSYPAFPESRNKQPVYFYKNKLVRVSDMVRYSNDRYMHEVKPNEITAWLQRKDVIPIAEQFGAKGSQVKKFHVSDEGAMPGLLKEARNIKTVITKTETPATPISPIEAKIKKGTLEGESLSLYKRGFKQFAEAEKRAILILEKYKNANIDVYGSFSTLKRRGSGKVFPDLDLIIEDKEIEQDILNHNKDRIKRDIEYADKFNKSLSKEEQNRAFKNTFDAVGRLDLPDKYLDLSNKFQDIKIKINNNWFSVHSDGTLRALGDSLIKEQLVNRIPLKQALENFQKIGLTKQQTLAEMLHTAEPDLTKEEAEWVTEVMIDPLAKALEITPDEVASQYIKQIKASTMAELEGKGVTYQPSGLPDDVVAKIETSLINNTFDDSISTNALRRYGKPHFVTISTSTPKEEAWTRLRKVLIDNPKGYDIVGGRTILTDREYLEGKRNKVQFQSQEQAQEFYSHLEDVIEKSSQSRYVPQQLLNYLKAQGVKDAEIEATGLREYLKEKGNVSKDELLEYLKGNQVEIKVIEKTDASIKRHERAAIQDRRDYAYNEYESLLRRGAEPELINAAKSEYDALSDIANEKRLEIEASKTKFSQWVEPGGENYKEILLTIPSKKVKLPAGFTGQEHPYRSTHYDEPNIVAHIRVNDRTDTNGKKVLFVEEIQSDWAKDLKRGKEGVPQFPFSKTWHELALKHVLRYASENGYDSIAWTTGKMQQDRYELSQYIDKVTSIPVDLGGKESGNGKVLRIFMKSGGEQEFIINSKGIVVKTSSGLSTAIGKNIDEVVGKDLAGKLLNDSFDKYKEYEGLDLKVGGKWAERLYDEMIPQFLNKYTKKWGGKTKETKIDTDVKGTIYTGRSLTIEEIDEYKRGIYSASTNTSARAIVRAMQEGMSFQKAIELHGSEDFADKIGGKLEWNRNIRTVQSLDITPSMRQSIMQEGQPLFQGNRGAIEFTKDGKAIIHILENADKSTFIHEMFHLYVEVMKRTPKLKAQLKILETWIGKPVDKWTVADNEKVAKGGEKYLWEGNAPTSALKAVFERFKTWLREVYKTAKSLDIKLSDDVRKMWDEWFGVKEVKAEVKQAESFTSDEAMINSYGEKELRAIVEGDYRPKLKELAQTRLSKITESKPVVKSSIGTLDNIDTVALSDIFKSEIDRGTPLNKLLVKRIVAGKLGVLVGDLTPEKGYKHKAVEEAYEYAIVKKGREIAQSDMSVDAKFEATKNLYAQQLNLSERTSTSIEKQQYSTPLPLAMAINEHLGIDKNTTVYEPTAGNGILLIGANPKKTVTNELAADYRQTHLKDQGFSTIQGDAMTFIKDTGMDKSFNTVVMNPPFGNAEVKLFDNYRVRKLEHQIALESLKAMEDNGNAAIIIGGHNFEHGKMTESDRIFLNYLYSHYNVTHNIDINGDVYRRMGTSFPIRLITIEGRKATPDNQFAPTEQSQVASANTFDDVRNRLGKPIQKEMEVKREDIGKEPITTRLPGKEGRGVEGVVEGRQKSDEPTGGVRDIVPGTRVPDTGIVEQPGYSKDIVGDIVREERGRGRTELPPEVTRGEGVRPEELPGRVTPTIKQSGRIVSGNIQDPYVPQSKGNSGKNLIPKNLVEPIAKILQNIEKTYGDVDTFVQSELQYKTKEELYNALSAEQIDAVSIIISNIKNGKSTILGDQTGVGKGRSVAATIRYANLQGIKPIFFTEKPNLLTDIYRDLVNINHKVNPFILHSDSNSTILDQEGNKVFKPSFVGESKTNMIQDPTKEMENYNVLMTTYSQINKENKQRAILRMLAQGNVIILDESHNAAGTSNTGEFLSKLLETAKTVVYSSATYAKRPDNMAVYHKTDIGKTGLSVEGLTDAIKLGGIPLQQWVASALAEGGQYTRTELDYSGTNLDITLDIKNESLHTKQSDAITSILRDIVKFDREKLKIIKEMDKEAVKEGKRTTGEDSTAAGVTSSNFSSVVHNMVGQLLLSFRADAAVDKAIAAAKEGRKPVITLMNTMETFLSNTVAEGNVSIGDPIGFSFKDVLKKALKGTLRYTEISPGGERFKKVFKLEELPDSVQAIYRNIESKINSLETTLPSSPIDYIKSKLVKAGYTVGEITNRKLYVDYSKTVPTLEAREETARRDRNAIINAFNSGKTKILIFNAAGATGISLHASEKFATAKEQRELLIVQPQLNIDTFKQAMGRVFRKGQVSKPRFTMIQTALPAEIRPTVILQKKLASLNANTTANKESSAGLKDVPDMMNSYGDSVVSAYLKQNPEINSMLGDPLGIEADKENAVDAMQKVTGKVALLPVQIQRQFYDDIEMAYKELIEHLDQIGENNLHTKEYNFQAKTLEKQVTNQGKDESNLFASSTYLEKISVKVLKKPFTKAKIEELVKDSLKGKTAEDFNKELLSKIEEVTDQYKDALEGELIEKRKEEIQYDINLIDYAFKKFKIGYSYSIPIIEDVYTPSVLVDIKHSKTSGNPAAPSKVHLVFAAAPPYQIYKTSLSRKEFISHADSTGEGIPSEWDELIPKEVRENRHVITGNLLQGFQRLGERAETINYTTESGEMKAGILLPRSTNINSLKEGGTTVGAKEALNYLINNNVTLNSENGEVSIREDGRKAYISVPKSKSDGAKYYLNKTILSVLDVEFSSFGNSMRSHVSIDKLLPLLETLEQETSTRFSIPAKEVAPSETVTEKKEGEETSENVGKVFFQEAHKEDFIKNVVDKFSNWNEEKKAYKEAVDNGLIKEDISDDFRSKVKQWVSFPRTVAKKYPIFKRFYDRAEKYFEDVDNYATTMGNTVKPYMDSANQETVNKLLIDARLNKNYAYSKEELQKAGHSEEVIKEYLSVVNTMNQGLHYMANMLNRSGNDIEEIYTFVSRVKGMKNLLKPYKALENKDNINKALNKTTWNIKGSQSLVRVFKKQELIDMGLTEEERLAYNSITKLMFKNSNYVPFKRYGDWFVAVNDAEGKLVEYSFHESQKEMRTEALSMVEKYPGNKVTSGNVKKMATEAYQNMPVSILTMLKEFDEQLDTEFSKVYANITGRGFPLHLIESKKILGFEKDLSKSISDYILGISKWMASKEARHDFSKMFVEKDAEGKLLLDPRKQAQLYGYTDRYVNYILGNSKEGSKFRQFMFRYYLGGVVKSAMLNFTQSLTTTLPTSAKYIEGSIIRRSRLMADAIKTAAIPIDKLKTIDPQLAEALQKALKDGVISEQMVKMLRGEVYGKKLNKLDKVLSYMFEFAEQSNRKIAFIMAYNEAITNGVKTEGRKGGYQVLNHEEAIKFAEDFVKETQFEYSRLNKSELMRGWKAPLFTFRVFAGSYLSLLKGMILEGEWKALSEALGVMLLLGGLAAFPGLKEIEKALELMGYDPKKGIKKKFGQWGDLSLHGVLYPLGIDLSGALGTIEIVPGDIQQGIVPAVGGLILGVPMDIPKRMGRAWTLLTKNKDVYRAVEAIMPEAIRNPMVAVRWIKEGEAKSATYEPITKVAGLDTALKFLGIQPATLSKAYEREHSESILRNINYSEGYNWRIAKALYKKDSDEFKDILEEIRKHNVKIGKAIAGGDKEAVKKYILPTRQGIQRNLLKMISPQASELKSMPKVLRPAYREIQEVMN